VIRHPAEVLYGVIVFYSAGVAWWLACSFFRAEYFTWPDVLKADLGGTVAHRYLFGPQDGTAPAGTIHVLTWATAERAIQHSLAGSPQKTITGGSA
jgi:hypothetical protein